MRYIEFDIDRVLKGRIAELVFERAQQKGMLKELLKGLECMPATSFCEPCRRHHHSSRISKEAFIEMSSSYEKFIHTFMDQLNRVIKSLGLEELGERMIKADTILNIRRSCFLCLRESTDLNKVKIHTLTMYICSERLNALLEKGLITKSPTWRVAYEDYELKLSYGEAKEVCNSIEYLWRLQDLFSRFYDHIGFLSEFDKQSLVFLYDACVFGSMKYHSHETQPSKTLARHRPLLKDINSGEKVIDINEIAFYVGRVPTVPHPPFDYICVDGNDNKYLIDVKSMWQGNERVSLSE
uniref:Uncharacterized protein n=1 Tax=Ignisphaera aggregans TaxID=334771 RepID=A0A7J2U1L7_9CREN